jgi:ATP-dependent Clp protease ATP-binding subunit ClpA
VRDASLWQDRLTSEASTVWEAAAQEAQQLKHGYLGQEHLLLALLRVDGVVRETLADAVVTYALALSDLKSAYRRLSDAPPGGDVKRYNLALPQDLFREVEQLAEREGITVLEVLRRSAKLGLLVDQLQRTPGAALIIREGDQERQLVVL